MLLATGSAAAAVGSVPTPTWQTNGRVAAVATVGGVTYIGGTFTKVTDHSGHSLTVSNLAALDSNGNVISTFHPAIGGEVKAVVATSSMVIAGGGFTTVAGKVRQRIAAFSRAGALLSFAARTNGEVSALALGGGRLYVGGTFTQASGRLRSNAAAFVIRNGLLSRWNPSPNGRVAALMTQPNRVFLGGFFTTVKGQASRRLAAVAPITGNKLPWRGHPSGQVLSLAQQNGAIYVGVSGLGGAVNRFTAIGNRAWVRQVNGNVKTIAVVRNQVYVGGHFSAICARHPHCPMLITRRHLLSLKTGNGDLTAWNPEANSALGVYILWPATRWLSVGGDFTVLGGVSQTHYGRFPIN
jgi:hypothetical protein